MEKKWVLRRECGAESFAPEDRNCSPDPVKSFAMMQKFLSFYFISYFTILFQGVR